MTQQDALDLLKMGHNIYLTGAAGSGKTYLLNKYIGFLKSKKVGVGITASTGIAATHMNGRTIHSWSGIGIKDALTKEDLSKLLAKRYLRKTFAGAKVLIIDEISMLHSFRLDMIDRICKAFKKNALPFGGIQVVLCGDFFQLPPVSKNGEDSEFVHKSDIWQEMSIKICYLDEQHRQEDKPFLQVLNDIRNHTVNDVTRQSLCSRYNKEVTIDIPPTKLFTHNADVDAINNIELDKIKKEPQIYQMSSRGIDTLVKTLKKNCLAPEQLILKKGAVVMFVKNNFDKGYVNGTLGKVMGFDNENYPIVETVSKAQIIAMPEKWTVEEGDKIIAEINQIPLRLAWAITVHKSQGMSLDAAVIDLSKAFEPGMGYVAISRVRTLAGIKLLGINETAYEVSAEALALDKQLINLSKQEEEDLKNLGWLEKRKRQKQFLDSVTLKKVKNPTFKVESQRSIYFQEN